MVKGISFAIGTERVALVGESGSGKTMTARAVMGLVPAPGRVRATRLELLGNNLLTLDASGWNRLRGASIGLVLQDPRFALNPVQRVGWQVEEPLRLHARLSRAERRDQALAMLAAVGLDNPAEVHRLYPGELSGGMGQRVMIAAMLIAGPRLLVADEPTSALDQELRDQVLDLLTRLVAERGMGLLLISHDLQQVARFADRALVMYRGRIVDEQPAASLARSDHPYTRTLWACRPSPRTYGTRLPVLRREELEFGAVNAVEVADLSVRFARGDSHIAAVRNVGFAVAEGETFGLVGPSGCGKSTVLRVIAGLQREWSGRVTALGTAYRPGRRLTGNLRRGVQMVFQDPYASLHPRHSIRRTLEEPLRVNHLPDARARAAEALAAVGLAPELARRYPNALSGGQRQRVAIARALLLRPRLLLLDEPTSALDMSVQAEILNLLNDLKAASGMTFILVSHDMDVIAHMCDRAAAMRKGEIVEVMGRERLGAGGRAGATPGFLPREAGEGDQRSRVEGAQPKDRPVERRAKSPRRAPPPPSAVPPPRSDASRGRNPAAASRHSIVTNSGVVRMVLLTVHVSSASAISAARVAASKSPSIANLILSRATRCGPSVALSPFTSTRADRSRSSMPVRRAASRIPTARQPAMAA